MGRVTVTTALSRDLTIPLQEHRSIDAYLEARQSGTVISRRLDATADLLGSEARRADVLRQDALP